MWRGARLGPHWMSACRAAVCTPSCPPRWQLQAQIPSEGSCCRQGRSEGWKWGKNSANMACFPACDRATKRRCRLRSITSAAASPPLRRYHEAGNIGVEHAAPGVIRAALAAPRRSEPGRQAFSREDLLAAGLVAELHARVSGMVVVGAAGCCSQVCPACSFQSWPRTQHCGWEYRRCRSCLPCHHHPPGHHIPPSVYPLAGRGRDGAAAPSGRLPGPGPLRWQAAAAPAQPLLLHAAGAGAGAAVGGAAAGGRRSGGGRGSSSRGLTLFAHHESCAQVTGAHGVTSLNVCTKTYNRSSCAKAGAEQGG